MTLRWIFFGFLLASLHGSLCAQSVTNVNPVISLEQGVPYYTHSWLPDQELTEIALVYCSSKAEIIKANPMLIDSVVLPIEIRIPFNECSALQMMHYADSLRRSEMRTPREMRKRNRDEKAIEEAVSLVPSDKVDPPVISDEEHLLLEQLTQTVTQGLYDLQMAEETLVETPFLDEDGFPKNPPILSSRRIPQPPKNSSLVDLLQELTAGFISDDSLSYLGVMHLSEYFLIRINPAGKITNVKDERTLTNHNTTIINVNDLYGRSLGFQTEQTSQQIIPVGLGMHLQRFYYPVKLKKNNQLKPLKPGTKETYLEPEGEHYRRITEESPLPPTKGKYVIEVVEGNTSLSLHEPFEYNPFGRLATVPFRDEVFEIIHWRIR